MNHIWILSIQETILLHCNFISPAMVGAGCRSLMWHGNNNFLLLCKVCKVKKPVKRCQPWEQRVVLVNVAVKRRKLVWYRRDCCQQQNHLNLVHSASVPAVTAQSRIEETLGRGRGTCSNSSQSHNLGGQGIFYRRKECWLFTTKR